MISLIEIYSAEMATVFLPSLLNTASDSSSLLLFLSSSWLWLYPLMASLTANWSADCPLLIKSFNRQSIKSYFPPPRARIHIFIQFVTMETAREVKICDHLMELKIVPVNYTSGQATRNSIISSTMMRLERARRLLC